MAIYEVEDSETGMIFELEGDSPPTEQELNGIFSQLQKPAQGAISDELVRHEKSNKPQMMQQPPAEVATSTNQVRDPLIDIDQQVESEYEGGDALSGMLNSSVSDLKTNKKKRLASDYMASQAPSYGGYQTAPEMGYAQPEEGSLGEKTTGAAEVALGFASGAIAQPIAGISGVVDIASGGDLESATEAIESTQEALTYQPKTEKGIEYQQSVGEVVEPVGKAIEGTGEFLGDATREATGSWILGGLAESIPEAVLTLVGVKGGKRAAAPKVTFEKTPQAALSQSAPEVSQIRQRASDLYKEIDEVASPVSKSDFLDLGVQVNNIARKSGFDEKLTPKAAGLLERVKSDFNKKEIKISDIDKLRKVAQIPANSIDNATEAAIGSKIISKIDDFLDSQGAKIARKDGPDVGKKYKEARNLASRYKKAEMIDEAVFKAGEAASGFENGLRNEMRSILKNKKKRRGYTPDEIKAMQQITQGGSLENTMKRLGRLGYGADQQTNVLGSLVGIGAGAQLLGPVGAVGVPVIGQISANIAKKLGEKNVGYLDATVRAGKNGKDIAKAYIDEVPKNLQKKEELTALLLDPSVDISKVKELGRSYRQNRQLINDAAYAADKIRAAQASGVMAASQLSNAEDEQSR